MTREKVTSLAATVMSAAASIATFYAAPWIQANPDKTEIQIIALLVGLPGFYFVFQMTHKALSIYRTRKFRGLWYYATRSYDAVAFKDDNFAAMRFNLGDGYELEYEVELYDSYDALIAKDSSRVKGKAYSDAISYDAKRGSLKILFHVEYTKDPKGNPRRFGRLFLNLTEDGMLVGNWLSDLHMTEISSGTMLAARPEKFAQKYEKWDMSEAKQQSVSAGE